LSHNVTLFRQFLVDNVFFLKKNITLTPGLQK
jgi:hypothetical protein